MTDQSEKQAPATAAAVLSELVARKAAARGARAFGNSRESERVAAARSASKSKPAMRRG
jgi:hypothetical protein